MFKKICSLFSPYAHPFEKKVEKFLKKINSHSNKEDIQNQLSNLLQENTAVFSLWLEKKFRNYHYLSKKNRREMYANLALIEEEFLKTLQGNENKEQYLAKIITFLKPNKRFYYEESSSFGKLLMNSNKMIGDCNQIVTFYLHLFSKKFPINLLKIKLLPNHVCLYFNGKDLEATTGQFKNYTQYDHILPVTEIVSTNLLDIHDFRELKKSIAARELLKSSQLAYLLSSLKDIVNKNLDIAYIKLGLELAKRKKFDDAFYFLELTKSSNAKEIIKSESIKAAKYFITKNNFAKANSYAKKALNSSLERFVMQSEALFLINKKSYLKAKSILDFLGDQKLLSHLYEKQYFDISKKIKHIKSTEEAKMHKNTFKKLLELAKKSGRKELEKWPEKVLEQIK